MKNWNLGKKVLIISVAFLPLYFGAHAGAKERDGIKFRFNNKYVSTIKAGPENVFGVSGPRALQVEIEGPVSFHDSTVKCFANANLSKVVINGRVSGKVHSLICEGDSRKFGHLQFTKQASGYLLDDQGRYGLPVDSIAGSKVGVVFHAA